MMEARGIAQRVEVSPTRTVREGSIIEFWSMGPDVGMRYDQQRIILPQLAGR